MVVQQNLILLNYHPASQSLGTPPKQGGEFLFYLRNPRHLRLNHLTDPIQPS